MWRSARYTTVLPFLLFLALLLGSIPFKTPQPVEASTSRSVLQFRSTDGDVVFPTSVARALGLSSGDYTVEFWANPAIQQNANADIIDAHLHGYIGWAIERDDSSAGSTDKYYWVVGTGSTWKYSGDFSIPAEGWHQIAITYASQSQTLVVYVDGQRKALAQGFPHPISPQTPMFLGRLTYDPTTPIDSSPNATRHWSGLLADVRFSNSVRYAQSGFSPSKALPEPDANTVAEWRLNEGGGTVVTDAGSHRYVGKLEGATTPPAWVIGAPGSSSSPSPTSLSVAMGDSYSAGMGATTYDQSGGDVTTIPGQCLITIGSPGDKLIIPLFCHSSYKVTACHRSTADAWGPILFRSLATPSTPHYRFIACGGATIADIVGLHNADSILGAVLDNNSMNEQEGPQLQQLRKIVEQGVPISLITLSIGGNDIGFASIIQNCLAPKLDGAKTNRHCQDNAQQVFQKINSLRSQLVALYGKIHRLAPKARILVSGYPRALSLTNNTPCYGIENNQSDYDYLNSVPANLDRVIFNAVQDSRVAEYIGYAGAVSQSSGNWDYSTEKDYVYNAWGDKGACSYPPNYIHAVEIGDKALPFVNQEYGSSFHPRASGYAKLACLAEFQVFRFSDWEKCDAVKPG